MAWMGRISTQKLLLSALLISFSTGFILSCSETHDETIARLEKELKNKKRDQVLKEAAELLKKSRQDASILLSRHTRLASGRKLVRSLNGRIGIWTEGRFLYYRWNNRTRRIRLSFKPVSVRLSSGGKKVIVSSRLEQGCVYALYTLDEKVRKIEERLNDCLGTPVSPDDTNRIYYFTSEGLMSKIPGNNQIADEKVQKITTLKTFKPKYVNIQNRFFIHDIPDHQLLIFHGAAGYYQMYLLQTDNNRVIKMGNGFARPFLIPASNYAFSNPISGDDLETKKEQEIENLLAFIYEGSPGKYSLHSLEFSNPVRSRKFMEADPIRQLTYIEKEKRFLTIFDGQLSYWNPDDRDYTLLPLPLKKYMLLDEGLIYEDFDGNLWLRQIPLTDYETRLWEMVDENHEI